MFAILLLRVACGLSRPLLVDAGGTMNEAERDSFIRGGIPDAKRLEAIESASVMCDAQLMCRVCVCELKVSLHTVGMQTVEISRQCEIER